ncbi:MAG TPA: phosphohistidine phosphatase SixA [Verrucomicrobiae bacterium]|jgi:phosphohistidine phosphatase
MTTLYLLRHGKAHPRGPRWRPDSERPLTSEGEKNMFDVARGLRVLKVEFDTILSSAYARAWRTAEIVAEVYGRREVHRTEGLAPGGSARDLIDEVNTKFAPARNIVLTGHEPDLSQLASVLLTGSGSMALELKKAGLCKLAAGKLVFGKCARLHWLLTGKQLARLGRQR